MTCSMKLDRSILSDFFIPPSSQEQKRRKAEEKKLNWFQD